MEICCVRQAPINFPFKFVFNRDLVSHAIYITDLNSKVIYTKHNKNFNESGTFYFEASTENVCNFATVFYILEFFFSYSIA